MKSFFIVLHAVISVLLTIAVLSQNRSSGLSATFGGGGSFYASKRGAEKVLHYATIVLSILFVAVAIMFLFLE